MLIDALLSFVPVGAPLSLVTGVGVGVPSGIIDILGQGVGQAPGNIIGNTLLFGADMGLGMQKIQLEVAVGTAFATSDVATLNVEFQGAPDTGLAGGYLPGTWQTFVETGYMTAAQLTASAVCARFDWPPQFPITLAAKPRFYRLLFQVLAATQFTAGTIAFAIPVFVRDDYGIKFQPNNYKVA